MSSSDSAALTALQDLIEVVARLRDPQGGCPWDLAQTPESLTPYIVEEAYETVHAIRSGQPAAIAEELGDLLLQVILQSQIASEAGQFSIAEVAQGIAQKLIRRHPHVFSDGAATTIAEVKDTWEQIKATEKSTNPDLPSQKISKCVETLPPLTAAMKVSKIATKFGFEWDKVEDVWAKFHEELGEFQEAIETDDVAHQESELGDVLFTIVNLARWYNLDPDRGLQGTMDRFSQRLAVMETAIDRPLQEYSLADLENLWQQAKRKLAVEGNSESAPH
jgi:XTP/dITP diphosphohydrolase